MPRGFLITCEGIDGSGKSTASRALVEALRARGLDARLHAEPTRTWLGEAVRKGFSEPISAWSEALLFMADHATHVEEVKRELAQGALVVSDRWSDSTFAYQGAALAVPAGAESAEDDRDTTRPAGRVGVGDAMDRLRAMEKPFDLAPHLTILFDLEVEAALRRVDARGAKEKFERQDFLERVRRNYLRLAKEEPRRFVVVDAARPAADVLADALAHVLRFTSSEGSL